MDEEMLDENESATEEVNECEFRNAWLSLLDEYRDGRGD